MEITPDVADAWRMLVTLVTMCGNVYAVDFPSEGDSEGDSLIQTVPYVPGTLFAKN